MDAKERKAALAAVWRGMHRDYKGKGADGVRRVMVLRNGGSCSVPLDSLSDAEIERLK